MNFKQPLENYKTPWAIVLISVITCTVVPARIYNWPSPSSPDWDWVLITLELMVGIGILAQLENKRLTDKDEIKKRRLNTLVLFVLVTGSLTIAYFTGKIELKDIITIIVLFGTVLVTAEYANDTKKIAEATKEQANYSMKLVEATKISAEASVKLAEATKLQAEASVELANATKIQAEASVEMAKSAKEQAEASVKMAEETRKQRYASVRPVIDIKIKELQGKYSFLLDNIGIGPATDVRSGFADIDKKGIQFLLIGALKAGAAFPEEFELPTKNKGAKTSIVVVYKDIYDQSFESIRELEMTATGLNMGHLIVKRLSTTEETFND